MKNDRLHNIKKTGFKLPKGYLDGLDSHLMDHIKLNEKVTHSGFKVPNGYFENIEQSILSKTKQNSRVIYLFGKHNWLYAVSVAAVIILLFNVIWNNKPIKESTIEISDIEQYLINEGVSSYELASLLTNEDLNTDNFVDSELSEQALEQYLMENSTLEDLITE